MTTHDKYELLTKPTPVGHNHQSSARTSAANDGESSTSLSLVHARHTRLRRDARMYVIPKSSVDVDQLRRMVTALSRLDHPLIPHLIDLTENEQSFQVITEFVSDEPAELFGSEDHSSTSEPFAGLQFLEQVASALSHAAQQGVAHGNLTRASFHAGWTSQKGDAESEDRNTNLKLVGLGLAQLEQTTPLETLLRQDLASLKELVDERLRLICETETQGEEGTETHESKSIEKFRVRLRDSPNDNIEQFSADLSEWMHRELSIREARKLAVSDRKTLADNELKRLLWPIVGAVAACLCLLAGGLAWYFLGGSTDQSIAQNVVEQEAVAPTGLSSEELDQPGRVTSSLMEVGKLNNPDALEEMKPADKPKPDESSGVDAPSDTPVDPEPMESAVEMEIERTDVETSDVDQLAESSSSATVVEEVRTKSPFTQFPGAIDLPAHTSRDAVKLVNTDLQPDEELSLSLVSTAAVRYPSFSLLPGSKANRWKVVADYRDKKTIVAELARTGGKLFFRWLAAANTYPNVRQLKNGFLTLSSGKWNTDVALRTPLKKRGVVFDLEPNRGFDLGLDSPPADMFVEFVPSKESLVVASPQRIPWKDGVMSLGLDAGKKSTFVLQLRPQSKSRLRTQTLARPKVGASFSLKKGFGRGLRANVQKVTVSLFQMKQSVNQIRGENADEKKKRVRAMIARLEVEKEEGEKLLEAYLAARMAHVDLRVGCEIEGRTLVLAEFVETSQVEE